MVNRWVVPTIGWTHKTTLIVTHLQYDTVMTLVMQQGRE
jgi:hypothetical protein